MDNEKVMNLDDTTFSDQYRDYEKEKRTFMLTSDISAPKIIACTVWAIAAYLSSLENKKDATNGVYFYTNEAPEARFFAGILEYDKNEDNKDNPGAFEFSLSYDPEVIAKANYSCSSDMFVNILGTTLMQLGGMMINDVGYRVTLCADALDLLKRFIENAVREKPGEVVEFEYPGIYMIRGGVEDGHVIVTMVPGADLKHKVVKDDSASEK